MEYSTDEINLQPPQITRPTEKEIEATLDTLNLVRLQCDQAASHLEYVRGKMPVNPKEVSRAFEDKQKLERQYMSICDWIWEYKPRGFFFDHEEQRYVLR